MKITRTQFFWLTVMLREQYKNNVTPSVCTHNSTVGGRKVCFRVSEIIHTHVLIVCSPTYDGIADPLRIRES